MNVSYWYQNTYGVTLGWQNTWGPANPVLYTTGTDVTNSANGKPNSNAFIIEADWVPFGKEGSWLSPWANLKLGVQYTAYTQFNGGNKNYDGFGRNASDNNTLLRVRLDGVLIQIVRLPARITLRLSAMRICRCNLQTRMSDCAAGRPTRQAPLAPTSLSGMVYRRATAGPDPPAAR